MVVPPNDPMMGPSQGANDNGTGTPALSNGPGFPGGQPDFGGAESGDPLAASIKAARTGPAKPKTPFADTKAGKLLRFVAPMLEGGLVGGFGGHAHSDGGFGAAQEFYAQRHAQQVQRAMLLERMQNDQTRNALERAKTQREIDRPNFPGTHAPIKVRDDNPDSPTYGKRFYFAQDTETGKWARVPGGEVPEEDGGEHYRMTDQGLVKVEGTTATPVTVAGAQGASSGPVPPQGPPASTGVVEIGGKVSPMYVARRPGSGAQSPSAIRASGAGAPLHAPGFGRPQHQNDFEQFYDKYLDENGLDDTSGNQLKARAAYAAAERKPTDAADSAKQDKVRNSLLRMQNSENSRSGQTRSKALADLNKRKFTMSDEDYAAAQQEIENDKTSRDQDIQSRYETLAQQEGVDLNGARSSGGKVAGAADVAAWAQKKGISIQAARRQFKAKGYTVQGSPQ
ncbi:MAG: hypothetical protein DMG44_17795 [Acidobacteria bacterium]|nr:MAG: hypothetical protein DMG44_17795 [Acidobacteriota bacterium]